MKKFIVKMVLYGLAPFVLGLFLLSFSTGKVYTYPPVVAKLRFLEAHPEYNFYFIGSSKINNQINPEIIDRNLPGVKSYNLGANGGFNLENYQVVEEVLASTKFQPKYIVLELQEKSKLTRTNLYSTRSFGMFDFKNTRYNLAYYAHERNLPQVFLSAFSFVLNVFHYDKTADENEVKNFTNDLVTKKSGFAPLDITQKSRTSEAALNKEIARRIYLYNADNQKYTTNSVFIEKINSLAEDCRNRNIKLILLAPAPAEPDAKKLNIYEKSFDVPIINLLSPQKFPQFYRYENRWDYGHLNQKGADQMSEIVARDLKNYIP